MATGGAWAIPSPALVLAVGDGAKISAVEGNVGGDVDRLKGRRCYDEIPHPAVCIRLAPERALSQGEFT